MSETKLRESVTGRAKRRGWRVAHAYTSFVPGAGDSPGYWVTAMLKGWPDLTLFRSGHRIIFIELKKELGAYEEGQLELLQLLNETGNYAITVRPSDLREGRVTELLKTGAPIA